VSFLGSSGLAVLVEARDHAQQGGHQLRLVCSSRIVLRALEATGLRDLFGHRRRSTRRPRELS